MPFDVEGARKAGYSDTEIAEYLGQQEGFNTGEAIKAGYSPVEIISHLTAAKPPEKSAEPVQDQERVDALANAGEPASAPAKSTAPGYLDSIAAMPAQAVAGGAESIARTWRTLQNLDVRIANLEDPAYEEQVRARVAKGPSPRYDVLQFQAEKDWLTNLEAERARLPELKAERDRLEGSARASSAEMKAVTPKDQGPFGKVTTAVAGSLLPTGMGIATAAVTGNPVLGALVSSAPVLGSSVTETIDAGNEARTRQADIAKLETPEAKLDYLRQVLKDPEAEDSLRSGAAAALAAIQADLAAGKISDAQARERANLAFDKFRGTVDYVAKHATMENAWLRGAFDTLAETVGESIGLGAFLKATGKPLRDVLKVGATEAGQELTTQLLQSISEKAVTSPDKTVKESAEEMGVAAGAGFVFGAGMGATGAALKAAGNAKDLEAATALIERIRGGTATTEDRAEILARELEAAVESTGIDTAGTDRIARGNLSPEQTAATVMTAPTEGDAVGNAIAAAQQTLQQPVTLPDEQLFTDTAEEPANVANPPSAGEPGESQRALNYALARVRGASFPGGTDVVHLDTAPVVGVEVADLPPGPGGASDSRSQLTQVSAQAIGELYGLAGKRVVIYRDSPYLPDGFVNSRRDPNTVFISDSPSRAGAFVAAHEFTHLLEGTIAHREAMRLIEQGLTPEGLAYLEKTHGATAPSDPVERRAHLLKEAAADLGGFALRDPSFLPKVIEQVRLRHGKTAAKNTLEKIIDGITAAIKKVESLFRKEPDVSAMIVSNLEQVRDALAKVYADQFAGKAQAAESSEEGVQASAKTVRVYHGTVVEGPSTGEPFEKFDRSLLGSVSGTSDSKLGFWFSTSEERAQSAAADAKAIKADLSGYSADVFPLDMVLRNPFVVKTIKGLYPEDVAKIATRAKAAGHDAVVFTEGEQGGSDYLVFNPDAVRTEVQRSPKSDIGHKRQSSTGRYVGAPDWVGNSPQALAAMRTKLAQLAKEGEIGRYWYEKSARAVLKFVGGDKVQAERFVGLLAIFSQGTNLSLNTTFALQAWYQHAAGVPVRAGRFPESQSRKAQQWLDTGKDYGGIKVNNFYQDLMEEIDSSKVDTTHATMDMWMALAFDYGSRVLDQGPKYTFAQREIVALAEKLGWRPHQVQAAIWTAIRARVNETEKKWKAREMKEGIRETKPDGKPGDVIRGREYDHFRLVHKTAMAHLLTQEEVDRNDADFGTELVQRTVNMSWEAEPGRTSGLLPGLRAAPLEQKQEYLAAVIRALTSVDGKDLVADLAGVAPGNLLVGLSAWEGVIGAGAQSMLPVPTEGTGPTKVVAPLARRQLDLFASLKGYVLSQDAVVWHLPVFDDAAIRHNGIEIQTARPLTAEEMLALYEAVHAEFNTWDIAPGYIERGARLMNFDPKISGKDFQARMERVILVLPDDFGGGEMTYRGFRSEGNYLSNNWQEQPNGESYQATLTESGRPDVLERAAGLRARVAAVNDDFVRRYGWDQVQRSAKARPDAAGGGRPGAVLPRSGQGLEDSVEVVGVHFSRERRAVLDSAYYNTGIAGAEAARLARSSDPRLKQRIYFYVPSGAGVVPERGVGAYAHGALVAGLYDLDADPRGIVRRYPDANAIESAVLDAGYSGVLKRDAWNGQGVAVLIGSRTVQVADLGDEASANAAVGREQPPAPRYSPERQLANRILAAQGLPGGAVSGVAWVRALNAAGVELPAGVRDRVAAMPGPMYRDEVARAVMGQAEVQRSPKQTIEVDGRRRPKTNSNGKPIAQTDAALRNFWRWFGDSKVVDGRGRPLVVYHVTDGAEFSVFDTSRSEMGSHFGTTPAQSNERAWSDEIPHASIPAYLAINNPLRLTDKGSFGLGDVVTPLLDAGVIDEAFAREITEFEGDPGSYPKPTRAQLTRRVQDAVRAKGYDGVVYLNRREGYGSSAVVWGDAVLNEGMSDAEWLASHPKAKDSYIAFRPEQIKSAIGNDGTFDANDPNIQRSPKPEDQPQYMAKAYHGTPHVVDRFSLDRIGTGEGAQAYGWGLYFAENPAVAEGYHRKLGGPQREFVRDGAVVSDADERGAIMDAIGALNMHRGTSNGSATGRDVLRAIEWARAIATSQSAKPGVASMFARRASILQEMYDGTLTEEELSSGGVYQVDIPDEAVAKMLDWDKPLSAQPEIVRTLRRLGIPMLDEQLKDFELKSSTGQSVYFAVRREATKPRSPVYDFARTQGLIKSLPDGGPDPRGIKDDKIASLYLASVGIPGIKYLDGMSRKDGDGTRNLVVFDDGIVTITHKDGTPVSAEERREVLAVEKPAGVQRSPKLFYSELEQAITKAKFGQAPASAWKDYLRGRVKNGQVKQAEVDDTGLEAWLAVQQGKVTREQLAEFVRAGGVRVETHILSNGGDVSDVEAWWNDEGGANEEVPFSDLSAAERADAVARYREEVGQYEEHGSMKFGPESHPTLWLPGGEQHVEILLTLPSGDARKTSARITAPELDDILTELSAEGYEDLDYGRAEGPDGDYIEVNDFNDSQLAALKVMVRNAGGTFVEEKSTGTKASFHSSHYPNLIGHIRAAVHTTADGKRYLLVNEWQSDWGQKYKKQTSVGIPSYKIAQDPRDGVWVVEWADGNVNEFGSKESAREFAEAGGNYRSAPPAPFVTDTRAWVTLLVKRAIAYAVEQNLDGVAWTTGEQQAERYDLSQQVNAVKWEKLENGDIDLTVEDKRGNDVYPPGATSPNLLADMIGKELADRILSSKDRSGEMRGLDLKVGGEGMKTFYDVIVPSVVNKVLADFGAPKASAVKMRSMWGIRREGGGWVAVDGQGWIASDRAFRNQQAAWRWVLANQPDTSQPGFPITDAMRAKIETQGQAQYSPKRTPEFEAWFKGSKVVNPDGSPKVVYHATDADFTEFARTEDIGFHFGTDPRQGEDRLRPYRRKSGFVFGARNIPVYLRITNPLRMKDLNDWAPDNVLGALVDAGIITKAQATSRQSVDRAWVAKVLAAKGYDGIIYRNSVEGVRKLGNDEPVRLVFRANEWLGRGAGEEKAVIAYTEDGGMVGYGRDEDEARAAGLKYLRRNKVVPLGDSYIVFHPNQIKSVFNARPTDSPDISRSPKVIEPRQDDFDSEGVKGQRTAFFGDEDASVTYRVVRGVPHLMSIGTEGDASVRGQDMVAWLGRKYGRLPVVEDVTPKARGFWEKMEARGLIASWAPIQLSPKSAITGTNVPAGWTATAVTGFDNLVRHLQDKLVDTKRVVQEIRASGQAITDNIDPYLQETLFHGRAAKRVNTFAETELRPLLQDMQARGVGMQELEDYLWARHAAERNAQIRKVNTKMPDGGSGLTDQQAADILAGQAVTVHGRTIQLDPARSAAYAALAARIDAITNRTLDTLVAYGLETQETVNTWRTTYKHYVPLKRDMESDNNYAGAFNLGLGTGQGFSVKGPASKRAMGSERAVIDILANLAMQRERAIVRGEKNRIAQAVYGLAVKAPNPDFWLPLNTDLRSIVKARQLYADWKAAETDYNNRLAAGANPNDPAMTSLELRYLSLKDAYQQLIPKAQALQTKVEQELVRMGMNPADAKAIAREPIERYVDPNTGMVHERINPRLASAPEALALRINGENRFVLFSNDERAKAMVEQLKNMNAEQLGYVLQGAAELTRWFASVNTQYNPVFGLVNGFRDAGALVLNLGATPLRGQQAKVLKYAGAALRGIYSDLRAHRAGQQPNSVWAQRFEEMGMEGGQTGYRDMFQTSAERADALTRELRMLADGKRKWVKINENNPIFAWLSDYNTAIENAIRVAVYQLGTENGMSKAQAARMAKEITVNFNKKGTAATTAGALYAFFNAAVQGTARIGQTMLEQTDPANPRTARLTALGKKIVVGGLALGVIQALLGAAAGWDDEEPKQFIREKNFLIPMPGGHYVSLPMPLGFAVLPNVARIATEFVLSGGKNPGKSLTRLFGVVLDSFNPLGSASGLAEMISPTVTDPVLALTANRDWTGQRIAKEDFDKNHPTPGWTRTKDTATPWAKALSYAINWVTGGGQYGRGLASPTPDQIDYLIGQVTGGVGRELGKVAQNLRSPATGEELPLHKVPVAGRFVGETTGTVAVAGRFYENLEKIGAHQDPIKRMIADGRTELVQDYMRNHPEARLYPAADQVQRKVAELNREKRRLVAAGEKDRVKTIEERTRMVMQNFNARVAQAEKTE